LERTVLHRSDAGGAGTSFEVAAGATTSTTRKSTKLDKNSIETAR